MYKGEKRIVRNQTLSEKEDVYGTAKKQMRLSERILAELPGFRGYKEKELRRESDKLIRNHLYQKLVIARTNFKTVFQKMSDRRQLDVLTDMDRVVAKFDRVAERVNHASYGYSGFFDAVKIQEEALDRMTDFDNQLVDQVNTIVSEVDAFKNEVSKQKFDKTKDRVQNLTDTLETFDETLDKREEVILGVS
jgi:ABC-type transporter Mla subunit MlaD